MDKKQMVDGLIANKHWKETDREFLMTLPDERVAAIHNMIPPAVDAEAEKKKKDKEEADAAAAKKNAAAPAPAQITLDQLPPEMRAVYNHGAAVLTAERDALIGTITANTANEFTAAQLQAMELPTLKAMARLAATTAPPPRYDGQGQPAPVGNAGGAYKEEPLMTPTINWDTAKA